MNYLLYALEVARQSKNLISVTVGNYKVEITSSGNERTARVFSHGFSVPFVISDFGFSSPTLGGILAILPMMGLKLFGDMIQWVPSGVSVSMYLEDASLVIDSKGNILVTVLANNLVSQFQYMRP